MLIATVPNVLYVMSVRKPLSHQLMMINMPLKLTQMSSNIQRTCTMQPTKINMLIGFYVNLIGCNRRSGVFSHVSADQLTRSCIKHTYLHVAVVHFVHTLKQLIRVSFCTNLQILNDLFLWVLYKRHEKMTILTSWMYK